MKLKHFALPLLLLLKATPGLAGNFYLMGAVGQSHIHVEQSLIDNALQRGGARGLSSTTNEDDTAYKIQMGFQFNRYFAMEGGYVDLGRATYTASFNRGSADASIKVRGVSAAILGMVPLHHSLSLFAKLGVINAKAETNLRTTGLTASVNSTILRPNIGVGIIYDFGNAISTRLEYEEFYKLGDSEGGTDKAGFWSLGLSFRF